jgi:hypothetical protein
MEDEMAHAYKTSVKKPEGKTPPSRPRVDGMMSERILKE